MADATVKVYGKVFLAAFNKEIDFAADTLKMILCTSSYTPDQHAHDYYDDITNELSTANGYTDGGATVAGSVSLVTAANATAWATGTAYKVGQLVRKTTTNGHLYRCIVAGTSHADTEPTWPTAPGEDIVDNGTLKWEEAGSAYLKLDVADQTWSNSTLTARYAVIYDSTPGSDATDPLICYIDFGSDKSSNSGDFTVTIAADGLILIRIA